MMCRARFIRRFPARESRCRFCSPDDASSGAVPFQDAKCALIGNLETSPMSPSSRAAPDGADPVESHEPSAGLGDEPGELLVRGRRRSGQVRSCRGEQVDDLGDVWPCGSHADAEPGGQPGVGVSERRCASTSRACRAQVSFRHREPIIRRCRRSRSVRRTATFRWTGRSPTGRTTPRSSWGKRRCRSWSNDSSTRSFITSTAPTPGPPGRSGWKGSVWPRWSPLMAARSTPSRAPAGGPAVEIALPLGRPAPPVSGARGGPQTA
jgi:hypothetical protein